MGLSDAEPTRVRYGVMAFLCSLAFILYLDRVCIAQAGTAMKAELGLSNFQWGLVLVAFQIAYAIFEPTTGHWGDRYGSRRVLIRIVLWWSTFTALTGCVWNFSYELLPGVAAGFLLLLAIRFLFGAGEAGALPNAARVVSCWFPPGKRGPAQALISTSAQIGGAAAPIVAAFFIDSPYIGWRWAFVIFGSLGVVWAWFFARYFRDDPATHPHVNDAERQYILGRAAQPTPTSDAASNGADSQSETTFAAGQPHSTSVRAGGASDSGGAVAHASGSDPSPKAMDERIGAIPKPPDHHIPWRLVFSNANIWLLGIINACTSFFSYMLFSWFPTYLKEGRGLDELTSGRLGSLPFLFGATGVLLGGYIGDWLTARAGSRRFALCSMGTVGLLLAGTLVGSSLYADEPIIAVLLCSIGFFFSYVQLAAWWACMADVGGRHLGALFGVCNMVGLAGGAISQVFLGSYADTMKALGYVGRAQWDPAFYLYGGVLMLGGVLWLFMNPRRTVVPEDATHV